MKPSKAGRIGALIIFVPWALLVIFGWSSKSFIPPAFITFLPGLLLLKPFGIGEPSTTGGVILLEIVSLVIYLGTGFLIGWIIGKISQKTSN